ncbi:hypothetical protein FGRMN_10022 [Fusarium graminum]|nr:hypothetical protein FGRMN_10022 [Fusarium graminum]
MPHKSPARKSGKASAPSSTDYPTERARRAAERIHKACGQWPADFAKGFGPEAWSVQLTTELSVLIELTVAASGVHLEEVRLRLRALTAKHIRSDHQRLLRSDIAKVREWLRLEKGVDTRRPRPSTGNMIEDDQVEDEEEANETEQETDEELEIIAKGIEVDGGEYDEDSDLTEEESETSAGNGGRTIYGGTFELSSPVGFFSDDDGNVEIVPPPEASISKPNGHFRVSPDNVSATREPAQAEPYTTATFAKSNSDKTSNTALYPKPNRNVVLGRTNSASQASAGSTVSTPSRVAQSSPSSASAQTIRAPVGKPRNGSITAPSSPALPSNTAAETPRPIVDSVSKTSSKPGPNLVNTSTPNVAVQSSQSTTVFTARPSENSETRPSNFKTTPNIVRPASKGGASLTRPNGPPKTHHAASNPVQHTATRSSPAVPSSTPGPKTQTKLNFGTAPSVQAQSSPRRGGILSPSKAANETRVAVTKAAANHSAHSNPAAPTVARSSNQPGVSHTRSNPTTNNAINRTSIADSSPILDTTAQPPAATTPSLPRSDGQPTAHSSQAQSSITQPEPSITPSSSRPSSQRETNPSSSIATPTISRPRRNIQPPIRQVYDTPQSSLLQNQTGQSRKRPADSPAQSTARIPNRHIAQASSAPMPTVNSAPTPSAPVVKATRPSSQAATARNNQSSNSTLGDLAQSSMNPPAKRQKTTDLGTSRPLSTGTLDWNSLLPSGDDFKESLKIATITLAPYIEQLEKLLSAINEELRPLASIRRTLEVRRDEFVHNKASATEALKDVDKETSAVRKIVQDLESISKKHAGDSGLRIFIDTRKKDIAENDEVRAIVKDQLDKSTNGLVKAQRELQVVLRRISQLDAEKSEVMREKEGAEGAAKRLKLMSRFMEPGWQTRLDTLESMMSDGNGTSQP